MKKFVIITTFLFLCLPFVLIKTIFPFYRFGMFAEPVKTEAQTEYFKVYYQNKEGYKKVFDGTEIGLSKSVYATMMRNYHYKNKEVELLEKTAHVINNDAQFWEMWRVSQTDSTQIGIWQP